MDIYISFHIVALIMLLITLIFCGYKNWILVAKIGRASCRERV